MPIKFPALFARHGEAQKSAALQEIRLALETSGNENLQAFPNRWDASDAKNFAPTALGVVIGHANHCGRERICVQRRILNVYHYGR